MRNRTTITRTTAALATSTLLVLGLAACGGSGDDEATTQDTATEESTGTEETTEESTEETTEQATEEGTTEAEGEGDFCTAFGTLISAQGELSGLDMNDPEAALATFEEFTGTLEAAEAPAELSDDWDTVAGGFRTLTDTLETATNDPENADPSAAMGLLSDEAFTTALTNVATYGAQNC